MAGKRALTAEDVLSFKLVADAQVSPDGGAVAFVVSDSFKTDGKYQKSNLWTVPTEGGDARQLTGGPRSVTSPRWSPDGETLAFLSDRAVDGRRQVYLLPTGGGEALRATDVEGSISRGLAWSTDGKNIAFLKTDPDTKDEKRRKDEKDDAIEFEKHPKYTRLYVMEVETGSVSCVSPDGLQVWEFCWSPTGQEVAAVASDLPFAQAWYTCRLVKFYLSVGPETTLYKSKRQVARPTWSPDGGLIAFLSSNWSDQGVVGGGVFVVPSDGGDTRELSASHVASASWLHWTDDSQHLVTAAHEQGGIGLAKIDVGSGRRTSIWSGEAVFAEPQRPQFSMDRLGNFAVVREDGENPRDVWTASLAATGLEWRRLTRLHPQADELDIASTETVRWRGADGWEMQGLLLRPPGAATDARQAMVTVVHGGPTSVHGHQYYAGRQWLQLLATQGIVVFLPNPRGSTGWGLEFAESNIGDMGGKDWEDIQLGVDHCIAEEIADPDRLGIAGWSYGGFMTAWAVTQTERFKAAMMGAGIADWRSFHGRSYLCDWDAIHYGDADPWDLDGTFKKFSPITYVKNAKTPTLIMHGAEDGDVPVEQSFLFYRALQDLGVESELVVYPREPHGLQERNHMLDLNKRITEWFVKHLEP